MMWATIIISGIITFTIRFSAIYKVTNSTTPEWLENILKYVPTSVLAVLIFPEIFLNESNTLEILNNAKILASAAALLVTILTKSIIITIITGMSVLWALTLN